jgi:endonuclease/exonuclease/phosphatase family metal-dependent hydrolase
MQAFLRLPTAAKVVVGVLIAAVVIYVLWVRNRPEPGVAPAPPGSVVFMFWNVENLFDDRDDRRNSIDDPYDNWFATDAEARAMKYNRLAEAILRVNGGKGPDILACCEVESLRAAELLRDTLDAGLAEGVPRYSHVAMKELDPNAGRFIAPCIISRVPLDANRTRLLGSNNLRILETYATENGHDLCLIASHWTSQLSDDGTRKGRGRDRYAMTIYAEYLKLVDANPVADVLVCGDFNDHPDAPPVSQTLRMTGDRSLVVPTKTEPRLFGLLSNKSPAEYGTHYYSDPLIYDQIGVSPGLLDAQGWICDPDSVAVPTEGMIRDRARVRRPWRFGNRDDDAQGRGYADHFPVVVQLRVASP